MSSSFSQQISDDLLLNSKFIFLCDIIISFDPMKQDITADAVLKLYNYVF